MGIVHWTLVVRLCYFCDLLPQNIDEHLCDESVLDRYKAHDQQLVTLEIVLYPKR